MGIVDRAMYAKHWKLGSTQWASGVGIVSRLAALWTAHLFSPEGGVWDRKVVSAAERRTLSKREPCPADNSR